MPFLFLAVVLATEPLQPEVRHHAVFGQPLATVFGLTVRGVSASGGVVLEANEAWSFVGDFSVLLGAFNGQGEDIRGTSSATMSLGWSARLTPDSAGLGGLFITPKVYGVVGSNFTDTGPSPIRGTNGHWRG